MKTIDQALADQRLLGAELGDLSSWSTWLAVLKAAFALELTPEEKAIFVKVAGDRALPSRRVRELWCVVGRRAGKSRMAAALAVFLALFQQHRLARGETGHVLVLAATQDQAKTVFDYAVGFIEASEALRREVRAITQHEIRLANDVVIGVHVNSFRTVRGKTLLACIFDETAFWRDETTANPDTEVYRAVMPSLIASGGMLIGISTPYRRMGLLHTKHRDHYAVADDNILVVQGSSEMFRPSLSPALIEAHKQADPEGAPAEWDAQFRSDISAFLSEDLIELATDRSRPPELPPQQDQTYKFFVDASGGRHDHYTACVGYRDQGGRFICAALRGKASPFDPQEATREIAGLAKEYRCSRITGDAYSADWIVSAFRECVVSYECSLKNRSELYLEGLPLFARGLVSLPEHRRLGRELRLLERHVSRVGRDQVDHGRNGSDDYANAVFGALHLVMGSGRYRYPANGDMSWVSGPVDDAAAAVAAAEEFQQARFNQHVLYHSGYYGWLPINRWR
jgi:hypothetical protein